MAKTVARKKPAQNPNDPMQGIKPNDPCPCGSDRKYKKCCGNSQYKGHGDNYTYEEVSKIYQQALHLYNTGDLVGCLGGCKQILLKNPKHRHTLFLTGAVLIDGGQYEKAINPLKAAININPDIADYHFYLSRALRGAGKSKEALFYVLKAHELEPDRADLLNAVGSYYQALEEIEKAVEFYHKSIEANPDFEYSYRNLCLFLQELGRYDEADEAYNEGLKHNLSLDFRIGYTLALPRVMTSQAELKELRKRLGMDIDKLLKEEGKINDPLHVIKSPPFYLAYHGYNDTELLKKHAELFMHYVPELNYTAQHCVNYDFKKQKNKIRVGFLSNYFWDHPVGACFNEIITSLVKRDDFEVVALTGEGVKDDKVTEMVDKGVTFVALPAGLKNSMDSIAEQELDILVYTDIGMNNPTYFMAFARLAPIQCVMAGHPNTTGIPNIDHFISVRSMEPYEHANDHYTEELLVLENAPVFFEKPVQTHELTREDFNLPVDKNLYACPMAVHKLHPQFDYALKAILEKDDDAIIIMFHDFQFDAATESLKKRLYGVLGELQDRVIFLTWMPRAKFFAFIEQVDVILDPFHFGGGTTTMFVMGFGTPIIHWPGEFMRARITYWAYKKIGVLDSIAPSQEAYPDLAVKIATDKKLRQDIVDRTIANCDVLFGDTGIVEEMAEFFIHIAHGETDKYHMD